MQTIGNLDREGSGAVLTTTRPISIGVECAALRNDGLRVSHEPSDSVRLI